MGWTESLAAIRVRMMEARVFDGLKRITSKLRFLVAESDYSELGVSMAPRTPSLDETASEVWHPKAGDLYLTSQYYESEDGITEAVSAPLDSAYQEKIEFMDDLVHHLETENITLTDPDTNEFSLDERALDVIARFVASRAE